MSDTRIAGCLTAAMLALPAGALGSDAKSVPAADAAFLEYLGSWDGDDEDWMVAEVASRLPPVDDLPPDERAAKPRPTADRAPSRREPPQEEEK